MTHEEASDRAQRIRELGEPTDAELLALCDSRRWQTFCAIALPIVTDYRTDIMHDAAAMQHYDRRPAVISLRPSGTFFGAMPAHDDPEFPPAGQTVPYLFGFADREHVLKQTSAVIAGPRENWTYVHLHAEPYRAARIVTRAAALDIITQYQNATRQAWTRSRLRLTA